MDANPLDIDSEVRSAVLLELLEGGLDIFETYHDGKVYVKNINVHNASVPELEKALHKCYGYSMPLEDDELLKRLVIMFSLMNKQNMDEDDLELKIRSLVRQINHVDKIPADIIIRCIEHMTKNNKWYPSYADIHNYCSDKYQLRKKLANALQERINYLQS
jgi:galactokinase/mevalonate kinase-like predicted kinase